MNALAWGIVWVFVFVIGGIAVLSLSGAIAAAAIAIWLFVLVIGIPRLQ